MPSDKLEIPEKVNSGGELIVKADRPIVFVNVYESPREVFASEDTDHKHPIWRGDIYETSHPDNFDSETKVRLKMRRGPGNKPALYGRYLVKIGYADGKIVERFLQVEHVHSS